MNSLRRRAYLALGVVSLHLVFGAVVRITGSGMGCGDHWPKCYGYWFPPLNRPDLIIEVSHRYLATIVTLAILVLFAGAVRRRAEPGVSGRGGVLRMATAALGTVLATAALGGVTVKLGNAPWTVVAHWVLAMLLLAILATATVRTGAMGGTGVRGEHAPRGFLRAAYVAAGGAFLTVAMGGLTANFPFAAVGCTLFPSCGPNPAAPPSAVHIQLTHRTIAVLLAILLVVMAAWSRELGPTVRRALNVAIGLVLLQIVIAGAMVLLHMPPALRSLHEATGVAIWLATFTLAYLARIAAGHGPLGEGRGAGVPPTAPRSGAGHRPMAGARS
ncbi:MAG TPA: COX15/CtaA family protein [Gemmatimonadaceae bacterium]|nr:COX15/CtaA family protein [Gemmatimonadaceae bacterium]